MFIAVKTGKLTVEAALTGGLLGLIIFVGTGFGGIAMMTAFFILGTFATSFKIDVKAQLALEEKDRGKRRTGQVIANAGAAAILGLLAWLVPEQHSLFNLMIAASFASATADTLSSELGSLCGRKFYNILTLKKDTRGLNGVVSIEGTIIGIIGSVVIAAIYAFMFGWNKDVIWIIVAGTLGNISDSILGATLERSNHLNNDAVNFINTAIAALLVLLLSAIS
jgi:uncharacterized protein (TIGR00297 family)